MSKKVIFLFFFLILFSSHNVAHANLTINEVMYDLSGADSTNSKSREWIEVYNGDTNDITVDASKWRIYDGSANRTINGEVSFSISANSYVIFAGDKDTFLSDNPGFGGVVYDTGITSLNNTGATIKLLDQDGNTADLFTYTSSLGGAGDGNSLQKISGSWVGNLPTPGAANQSSTASSYTTPSGGAALVNSNTNNNVSTTQTTTTETKAKPVEESPIKAKIIAKNIVFVGTPLLFQATAFGHNKEKLFYGKYFWNFGDGDSKEMQANNTDNGGKFPHTYFFPGDYIVTLEYYMNSYADTPDASDKMIIKVVGSDIVISAVGDEKDFFVQLTNNTDYDADLSNWVLSSRSNYFTFPKNTIINSKNKIIISSHVTHFSPSDEYTLKLMTPQRETVFDYWGSVAPIKVVESNAEPSAEKVTRNEAPAKLSVNKEGSSAQKDSAITVELPTVPVEDLSAATSESEIVKSKSFPYTPAIAFLFIGASAGAAYFVRRKGVTLKAGDDFKILDE